MADLLTAANPRTVLTSEPDLEITDAD